MKLETTNRKSNIELLRIIAMLMIVAHHFSAHGYFNTESMPYFNLIWLHFLSSGGKIGVNLFMLISGYFLISSDKVSVRKVLKLLLQMVFYSVSIFLIFGGLKITEIRLPYLIKLLLGYPTSWYARGYLTLYLIHPYINKLLNSLDKHEYKKLVLLLAVMFSILPTLTAEQLDDGNLVWFVFVYILGGYLKKYSQEFGWNSRRYMINAVVLYMLTFASVVALDLISLRIPAVSSHTTYLFGLEKITTITISVFVFLAFINTDINHSKIINTISSATFGIYFINDNNYMRYFFWESLFNGYKYSNTGLLIPYSLMVTVAVFLICLIVELIRINLLERIYSKAIDKISDKISALIEKC